MWRHVYLTAIRGCRNGATKLLIKVVIKHFKMGVLEHRIQQTSEACVRNFLNKCTEGIVRGLGLSLLDDAKEKLDARCDPSTDHHKGESTFKFTAQVQYSHEKKGTRAYERPACSIGDTFNRLRLIWHLSVDITETEPGDQAKGTTHTGGYNELTSLIIYTQLNKQK